MSGLCFDSYGTVLGRMKSSFFGAVYVRTECVWIDWGLGGIRAMVGHVG